MTTNLLTDSQLYNLSILADHAGDDRVFALCGRAYNGDRAARRELTVAWNAARARARARARAAAKVKP